MSNKKIAVYAGTFDPLTNGHRDIIVRAASIFDELIVAVTAEPKKKTLFSPEQRVELINKSILELSEDLSKRVHVEIFKGLLVDYVKSKSSKVIIRGLRAVSDYEYESQMAVINRTISDDIETVFLMTSEQNSFISSSVVREVAKLGGDVSGLVPKAVAEKIKSFFAVQ